MAPMLNRCVKTPGRRSGYALHHWTLQDRVQTDKACKLKDLTSQSHSAPGNHWHTYAHPTMLTKRTPVSISAYEKA